MTKCTPYDGGSNDFIKGDGTCYNSIGQVVPTEYVGTGVIEFYKGSLPTRGREGVLYINKTVDKSYLWDESTQQYVSADSKEYIKLVPNEPDIGNMEEGVIYVDTSSELGFMNIAGNKILVLKPTFVKVDLVANFDVFKGREELLYYAEDARAFYIFDKADNKYIPITAESREVKAEADLAQEVDLPSDKIYITITSTGFDIEDSNDNPLPLTNKWQNGLAIAYQTNEIGDVAKEDVTINGVMVRADKVKVVGTDRLEITVPETLLYQGTTIGVNR